MNFITTVVTSSAVTGLLILIVQTFLKQGITQHYKKKMKILDHDYSTKLRKLNYSYDEKLAKFNEQITIQSEDRKADFDRRIHDFTLYSTKRHEVYPELFKEIYILFTKVIVIEQATPMLLELSFNTKDTIIKNFEAMRLPLKEVHIDKINRLIKKQTSNNIKKAEDETISNLYLSITNDLMMDMDNEMRNLFEFFAANSLYMSDKVYEKSQIVIVYLQDVMSPTTKTKLYEIVDTVSSEIEELKNFLKEELKIGDYSI